MRIAKRLDLLLLLPLTAVLAAGCGPSEGRAVREARRITAAGEKGGAGRPEIAEAAARLDPPRVGDGRMRSWSSESVETVRAAASSAAFYFPEEERFVTLEEKALEEKLRRGPPGPRDLRDMFHAYMSSRSFDKAKDLRARFPAYNFPSMPEEFSVAAPPPAGRPVYAVGPDWRKVERTAVRLERFLIVMATFPGCPASEAALEDLLADPRTSRTLRERTLLLTDRFDAEGVAAVRKKFQVPAFFIAAKRSEYPDIAFDASPRFYFLKDGKVVSEMTGWGGAGGAKKNRADWLAELEKAAR